MEKFLDKVTIGLLTRYVLCGLAFIVSFEFSQGGFHAVEEIYKTDSLGAFALSIVIGAFTYGLHRSLLYPFLEWALTKSVKGAPNSCKIIITQRAMTHMLALWDSASTRADYRINRQRRFTDWGDIVHSQLVSAFNIFLGALVAIVLDEKSLRFCICESWELRGELICAFLLFLIAGLYSNARLVRMQRYVEEHARSIVLKMRE